jgi:hypothetical protein
MTARVDRLELCGCWRGGRVAGARLAAWLTCQMRPRWCGVGKDARNAEVQVKRCCWMLMAGSHQHVAVVSGIKIKQSL